MNDGPATEADDVRAALDADPDAVDDASSSTKGFCGFGTRARRDASGSVGSVEIRSQTRVLDDHCFATLDCDFYRPLPEPR